MDQIVTIESYLGPDSYGAPRFGPPVRFQARISNQVRQIPSDRGEETISNVTVYLNSPCNIELGDRVTLPIGYAPNQPKIQRISKGSDSRGFQHVFLYC